MAIRDQIRRQEPQQSAVTSTSAECRSGETATTDGHGPDDAMPRTLRQKARYENLMEEAVSPENYQKALKAVVSNDGVPGIDGMKAAELKEHLDAHWGKIQAKLLAGTYVPTPVKRVEIRKLSGGVRMLGIPTVLDRFIQQLLLLAMTPIFEPMFSNHSYGFRPGRSPADAIQAAKAIARTGKDWVVDFDISKFFDHVNHDILVARIAAVIRDKRVLKLIGKFLRRGAMVDGVVITSEEGTPQGGPLSPLLANIYLDALDKELDRRGHAFCRYADDCNIYVSSQAAAERTLASIQNWIEQNLRLKVNAAKSGVGRVWERKFLGFRLNRRKRITIAPESLARFKDKVREKFRSCQSLTSEDLVKQWQQFIRGWWGYYRTSEDRRSIFLLEPWIRRHIRKFFWLRWHGPAGRKRKLRSLGLKGHLLKVAHSSKGAWHVARTGSLNTALSSASLRRSGFLLPSELAADGCR
jgi:group II intron reverse transcriptase/maturase